MSNSRVSPKGHNLVNRLYWCLFAGYIYPSIINEINNSSLNTFTLNTLSRTLLSSRAIGHKKRTGGRRDVLDEAEFATTAAPKPSTHGLRPPQESSCGSFAPRGMEAPELATPAARWLALLSARLRLMAGALCGCTLRRAHNRDGGEGDPQRRSTPAAFGSILAAQQRPRTRSRRPTAGRAAAPSEA